MAAHSCHGGLKNPHPIQRYNLNVVEPRWFMTHDISAIMDEDEPMKFGQNNKRLQTKKLQCELLYAQRNYKQALSLIEEIFSEWNMDKYYAHQHGKELIDILIRCLCKMNEFETAIKYIKKWMVRDVSFSCMQLMAQLYSQTNQHKEAFQYSLTLTTKEPLNPICWYQLALCSKNIKHYDFGFVCLRFLEFNVRYYSKQIHVKLLTFSKNEMDSMRLQKLNTQAVVTQALNTIGSLFDGQEREFLEKVCKRCNFNKRANS